MPPEDRTTKGAERCHEHPGVAAIATCEGCGRPVCLTCAVPVRGAAYGIECLPSDVRTGDSVDGRLRPAALTTAGIALVVALVSTALPWVRQGRWFGAWVWPAGRDFPWSMVAAPAALLGCVVWWSGRRRGSVRRVAFSLAVLGAAVSVGAYLAVGIPPEFTRPWVGPYVAGAAGLAGLSTGVLAAVGSGRRARAMS